MQTCIRGRLIRALLALLTGASLGACSMSDMVVKGSLSVMDGGVEAMNQETDLEIARAAIPANLKLAEGLIIKSPDNVELRLGAGQALYGYAFAFVEDDSRGRASLLYERCLVHMQHALAQFGVAEDIKGTTIEELRRQIEGLNTKAVPTMFWTASCLIKWIDMNREDPLAIAQLGKSEVLMQRVLELDETYFDGGVHLFFGAYYGGRAPMFGGDPEIAKKHFALAKEISGDKLLIGDYLYALTVAVQQQDQEAFRSHLLRVIDAPVDLYPEQALSNEIARSKSITLLASEGELF